MYSPTPPWLNSGPGVNRRVNRSRATGRGARAEGHGQCDLGHIDYETVIALLSQVMQTAPNPVMDSVSVQTRVLDAALACIARFGIAKTTLDDVAREAGCARATVYRYFGSKPVLLARVVEGERDRIVAEIGRAAGGAETLEDALVAMATTAASELHEHQALNFVLAHEPERVLSMLTFDGGSEFLTRAADILTPMLARFLPADDVAPAAEWVARVFFAYYGEQAGAWPLADADADQVREFVREFVAPALDHVSSHQRG